MGKVGIFFLLSFRILAAHADVCPTYTGTPWQPQLPAPEAPRSREIRTVYEQIAPISSAFQATGPAREVVFEFPVTEDLGDEGSITLVAEVLGYPDTLQAGADPALVSLIDGEHEWIGLPRAGAPGDCAAVGYLGRVPVEGATDGRTRSVARPRCEFSPAPGYPIYRSVRSWWRRQSSFNAYLGTNTIPGCTGSVGGEGCRRRRLRFGPDVRYQARYALLSEAYLNVPEGYEALVRLTVIKKIASGAPDWQPRRLDLNFVIVGSDNIRDSRTAAGKRNLDALLRRINRTLSQPTTRIGLGSVRVYEWGCENGGDAYARVSDAALDPEKRRKGSLLGNLFEQGSLILPEREASSALNLFLVKELIEVGAFGPSISLGKAGGFGGPAVRGTPASGVAVPTYGGLQSINPKCLSIPGRCLPELHSPAFAGLASTVTHEIGHFLGLQHTGEANGIDADELDDTPVCSRGELKGSGFRKTIEACIADMTPFASTGRACAEACVARFANGPSFCPDVAECEFNHVMWYSQKRFLPGGGFADGELFSPASSMILRRHPLVR